MASKAMGMHMMRLNLLENTTQFFTTNIREVMLSAARTSSLRISPNVLTRKKAFGRANASLGQSNIEETTAK